MSLGGPSADGAEDKGQTASHFFEAEPEPAMPERHQAQDAGIASSLFTSGPQRPQPVQMQPEQVASSLFEPESSAQVDEQANLLINAPVNAEADLAMDDLTGAQRHEAVGEEQTATDEPTDSSRALLARAATFGVASAAQSGVGAASGLFGGPGPDESNDAGPYEQILAGSMATVGSPSPDDTAEPLAANLFGAPEPEQSDQLADSQPLAQSLFGG